MFGEDALAARIPLNELHGLNSAKPASSKGESADAAEGVDHAQSHATTASLSCSPTRPCCLRFMRGLGLGRTLHTATSTN